MKVDLFSWGGEDLTFGDKRQLAASPLHRFTATFV